MSRIYSSTNRIKFTDIPEKYAIPRGFRAKQSDVHTAVVSYVIEHYKDTKKYRQQVVDALNCLTCYIMQNNCPPFNWKATDPLNTMPDIDLDEVEKGIGDFYLTPESIDWDVAPVADNDYVSSVVNASATESKISTQSTLKSVSSVSTPATPKGPIIVNKPLQDYKKPHKSGTRNTVLPTPKEDLYIQPPKCPRFDVNKIWLSTSVGGDSLVIYTTLPEIPTRQNEISITTNPDKMSDAELMALYPNQVIHTRNPIMYQHYDGMDYDEDLGCLFPISGFTREQLIDNIIQYPHLYRLRKVGPNGELSKFFQTIEISGELLPIETAWDNLPDAKFIPRDPEFVKEYVVRRYLLEEKVGIKHKYNIAGTLDPFLTLFMPYTKYIERGYTDTLKIVKQCVNSRIRYKQSRSPILQRIEEARNNA